jgi:NAD(P)-dependent dehydrogenase (short-subunit alcohol dehydrogenase family)
MRLRGTVALVTGGSSGIGAATARALAAAGARPLIAGRDPGRLQAIARETGGVALAADLAAADGPAALAEAATRAAGPGGLDVLVNNAGIGWAGPTEQMTAEQAAALIAVDLTAPIQLTRLLVPGMIARGHGHVVFVSSIAGATGVPGEAVYSAAKAGVGCFAESLAAELAGRGIGISVIVPGVIDTPFFERRGRPYERKRPAPLPAVQVARALVRAIEREQSLVFVPRWMRLPAWLHGALPGTYRRLASRFG